MTNKELTTQFGKKTIPDIRPGDTIRVYFKIIESGKTRIQIFEGLVIAQKHGKGLDGSIKLRKISGGIGVERTFPIHSPLITKFEKINSTKVRRSKLYFMRNIISKKRRKKDIETKDYKIWEEALTEEELAKIEEDKARVAKGKAEKKAEKEKELKEKFEQAVESRKEEEKQ